MSALAIKTPTPPCTRITVSSMWIGSAIIGLARTSSTVIGLPWKTAPGMRARVGALVDGDLGNRGRVVAELRRVALSDLRVRRVLTDVAVRDLELGLR